MHVFIYFILIGPSTGGNKATVTTYSQSDCAGVGTPLYIDVPLGCTNIVDSQYAAEDYLCVSDLTDGLPSNNDYFVNGIYSGDSCNSGDMVGYNLALIYGQCTKLDSASSVKAELPKAYLYDTDDCSGKATAQTVPTGCIDKGDDDKFDSSYFEKYAKMSGTGPANDDDRSSSSRSMLQPSVMVVTAALAIMMMMF